MAVGARMVSKVIGALAAFAAAIAAGLLAFVSLRRLQKEAVAEEVDGLRAQAKEKNDFALRKLRADITKVRAQAGALGDDREQIAALLDED